MIRDDAPQAPIDHGRDSKRRLPRIIGELLLIISGVIIALGAENWGQERALASDARATAALLIAELEADSVNLAYLKRRLPRRDTAAARFLSAAHDPGYPPDSALAALWTLRFHTAYAPSRASFDRLVQSEGLRFIGPPELQTRTIEYFQERQAGVSEIYQYFNDQQEAFSQSASRHVAPAPTTLEEGLGGHGRMSRRLATPWDTVRNDALLLNDVWYVLAAGRLLQDMVEVAERANYEVRQALARELGRSSPPELRATTAEDPALPDG